MAQYGVIPERRAGRETGSGTGMSSGMGDSGVAGALPRVRDSCAGDAPGDLRAVRLRLTGFAGLVVCETR